MKDKTFYTSDGFLTAYGLACGYVEKFETKNLRLQMYKEHNTFHVRLFTQDSKRLAWHVFDGYELTKARAKFKEIKREMKANA